MTEVLDSQAVSLPIPVPPHASAMRHTHEQPEGVALVEAARTALESAGEQWTTMRAQIFDTLAGFGRPASAYDIADRMSEVCGRRIAANSVYRILDLFVSANLATRVEIVNAYLPNPHPGCLHDCIFLVCDACGRTTHLDDDSIASKVRDAAQRSGFRPDHPVVEVRGHCAACTG